MLRLTIKLNGIDYNLGRETEDALKTMLFNIYPFIEEDVLEIKFIDDNLVTLLNTDELLDKLTFLENDKTLSVTINLFDNISTSLNENLKSLYQGLINHLNNNEVYFVTLLDKLRYRGYNSTTEIENDIKIYRIFTRKGILKINKS